MSFADLLKAADFAAKKHKNQRRKDSEQSPYINHPIGVAHILTEEGGVKDVSVLITALLHDTVEDTDTSFEEIELHFGREVADLVAEVTDDKSLPYGERKRLQVEIRIILLSCQVGKRNYNGCDSSQFCYNVLAILLGSFTCIIFDNVIGTNLSLSYIIYYSVAYEYHTTP